MGLRITFYIRKKKNEREEKTRAWWHQVHKQGLQLYKSLLGTSGVIHVQSKLRRNKFI